MIRRRRPPRPVVGLRTAAIVIAGSAAASLTVVSCSSPETDPGDRAVTANATVVRIVDGDTIVADVDGQEEKVRLIGIDTPESVKVGSEVECFGKEASAHAGELLDAGDPVRLELDAEARDRYDRLLAYVYRADDGLFVNLAMVRDGYANSYTFPPNITHTDDFRDAAATARENGVGLWSACADDLPFPADQR